MYSFWRPDKTHPKRFIFNYVHRTIGISTFIFSSKFKTLLKDVLFLIIFYKEILIASYNDISWRNDERNAIGPDRMGHNDRMGHLGGRFASVYRDIQNYIRRSQR